MNFVSFEFSVFLLCFLIFQIPLRGRPALYRHFLLLANLVFYARAGLIFVPLLAFTAFIVWLASLAMDHFAAGGFQQRRKFLLAASLFICLASLAFFKYGEMIFFAFGGFFSSAPGFSFSLTPGEWGFPAGISFYTFQAIAFLVERYKTPCRTAAANGESYLGVLTYLSFFPTVMAGPILRPDRFFPQLEYRRTRFRLHRGFLLILSGLLKKVVIASYLSEYAVREVFQTPELFSSFAVLGSVYAYAVQIYCDFSGYTDLALGIGCLIGFELPRNFDAPYLSASIRDFWKRWHISLSSWLRDYLYIPLGGSRRGNRYFNLFVTMVLGGLWHGAHPRYLVWGVLHGGALALNHGWAALRARRKTAEERRENGPLLRFLSAAAVFHFVCFAWIFFRAEDMAASFAVILRIGALDGKGGLLPLLAWPAMIAGFILQWAGPPAFRQIMLASRRIPWPLFAILCALVAGFILRMGPEGVMPFIYFSY
ncbi:MAG: hypothetical protein LBB82_00955 [Treponema sp.]|jgi:D-alanyl-lipoteichoic acid acyltransferase DltB (MBOAT superfamily)|nr:hypothetical protein [Treponema sp.]